MINMFWMAIEIIFQSPYVRWSKLFFNHSQVIFYHLWPNFQLHLVIISKAWRKLSKYILHAPSSFFPNSVASNWIFFITIQPSRFLGWQLKPIFGHHKAQQKFFKNILHVPFSSNLVVNNQNFQTLPKTFGQWQKKISG